MQEEAADAMDHITNVCNSMSRYFTMLEHTGYYDEKETRNLLIYMFVVNEILEGKLGKHLDDAGLAVFEKLFRCLYKGCLIDAVRDRTRFKEENQNYFEKIRHSQTIVPRITEEDDSRIPEIGT